MLAMGLMIGCVNVKVCDCKPKHHEGKEAEDGEEAKEEHESKQQEGKVAEDREDEKPGHEWKERKGHKEESEENEGRDSKAKLQARAKITERKAREIAMGKVPNGTIKEGELEEENGKLQWSFDISTPGSKDITEVNIDATTGKVIAVTKETAADQAKERDEDSKKEKKEKDDN